VDLIFVMAGRMSRKRYALDLYREGVAPRLVMSVGRFEVSKMAALGLDALNDLKALRDRTPADERHFFLVFDDTGIQVEKADLRIWNTYGELLALKSYLDRTLHRRVIVVSSDVHLRRVTITLAAICRESPVEFLYCAVPRDKEPQSLREEWRMVVSECLKLTGYRVILAMPLRIATEVMRFGRRRRRATRSS
jgi:hypothetical protein